MYDDNLYDACDRAHEAATVTETRIICSPHSKVSFQNDPEPEFRGFCIVDVDATGEVYDGIGPYDSEATAAALIRMGEADDGLFPDATSCTGCA